LGAAEGAADSDPPIKDADRNPHHPNKQYCFTTYFQKPNPELFARLLLFNKNHFHKK